MKTGVLSLCTCLFLSVAGCSSVPSTDGPLESPLQYLAAAEKRIDKGEGDAAMRLIDQVGSSDFRGIQVQRYQIALANAYFLTGEYWDCYRTVEKFPRDHPLSRYLGAAESLTFRAGAELAASGWSFLGIVSDIDSARRVLEQFLLYYPRSVHRIDALRILGEAAWLEEDWDEAIRRFTEIRHALQGADSRDRAWADLAGFRIALSYFNKVQGPDYDQGALEQAKAELSAYLQTQSKNPDFVDDARRALTTTLAWIEEKRLRIARFYLRVDNAAGARLWLERILEDPSSPRAKDAKRLLARVRKLEISKKARRGR